MTEPMNVDTDVLDATSAILKSAAGQIPTQLPQFSVNGSDPLSAATRAGSAQVEAPMAALPRIKAEATTTAQNIGLAGQRYRETDEILAEKARQQQFKHDEQALENANKAGNVVDGVKAGVREATDNVWKTLRWFDLGSPPEGVVDSGAAKAVLANDFGALTRIEGTVGKLADKAWILEAASGLHSGVNDFKRFGGGARGLQEAIENNLPKTGLSIAAGMGGAEGGAAMGAAIGTFFGPGVGTAIGAGVGALVGGVVASDMGKAAGEALSDGIDAFEAAGSWSEKATTIPQTLVSTIGTAGSAAIDDVTGAANFVASQAKNVWSFVSG